VAVLLSWASVSVLYSLFYWLIPFTSFWSGFLLASAISIVLGYPISLLAVSYAIKIKSQSEEAEANNETKNRLINILGHDLKSPLNNIQQTLYMLDAKMISPEEFSNLVRLLSKNVESTLNLTNNLIKWIHLQQRDFTPRKVRTRIISLLQESIDIYQSMASDKRIDLQISAIDDYEAESDPEMIKIVLRNLLSNAIKYTNENGKVVLTFSVMGNLLVFQVKDNGVGMSPERVNSLFKLVNLESAHGTHDEKGTGLGLNLCKNVADKLGGHIWVRSEVGKGTTFYFSVPSPKLVKIPVDTVMVPSAKNQ